MRGKKIDISGQTFGKLTVLHRDGCFHGSARWACQCSCGNLRHASSHQLTAGKVRSCGKQHCRHGFIDGLRKSITCDSWKCMIARCTDPRHDNYQKYGGAGITVCDAWLDFANFYKDMGERPSKLHTINRKDNKLGYFPENCEWADKLTQTRNRSCSRSLTVNGVTRPVREWASEYSMPDSVIYQRLDRGWEHGRILMQPVGRNGRRKTSSQIQPETK